MTALLKKRALAEYTTQVQEVQPKPIKKLKLSKKASQAPVSVYVGLLENCKSSNEALQLLMRISDTLQFKEEDLPTIIKRLAEHFNHQSESVVRVKVLSLFSSIGTLPGASVEPLIDITMKLIRKEVSHKVIAQGLSTLLTLARELPEDYNYRAIVLNSAKQHLTDTNHWVKRICLNLIGYLKIGDNTRLIADYIHSQDARVRCAAFTTLITLHEAGHRLDVSMYQDSAEALFDDYEIVREEALKMVCLLGNTYPENLVKVMNSEEEIRLIDDAFGKICQSVNDLSMSVRMTAAQLLGTMTKVSSRFLHQTLDKKLMSNMRKKKSLHERSSDIFASGEWSSGRKWADDKPKELLDKDSIQVLPNGACGAFVHGLEDEFMEVRSASVDAICCLGQHNPEFAVLALDFLVDMFNDEIEGVRIKAIDCLTTISRHITLRAHQLETILGALEDSSIDVREGLHRMLAACTLSTKSCLQMCIDSLLDNLKKYPQDKKSTWKCVQEVGSKHADQALPLVPQLLGVHPFFDTSELDVEDPSYNTLLILVFNAAKHCPTMLQLFEEHTIKHYSYLRVTMPSLVPHLDLSGSVEFREPQESSAGASLLYTLLRRIADTKNPRAREHLINLALPQLDRLAEIDVQVAGAAQFTSMFISAQVLMVSVLQDKMWCSNAATSIQGNTIRNNITQILTLCLKLQYLFVGLGTEELKAVKQFKLKALALHLVYIVRVSNLSALALCDHFLSAVEKTQRYLSMNHIEPDEFTVGVFSAMSSIDDFKPGVVARHLLPLLNAATPVAPPTPSVQVRMCRATLAGPTTFQDAPLKLTAGLIMAVNLDAEIYGMADPSSLRIRIYYPDHQTHVSTPTAHHLRPTGFGSATEPDYRLLTKALVSHGVWTEPCYVEVSLCLELSEGELTQRTHYSIDAHLDICKPIKLYIAPKAVKRGI